jgi:hypothetical protein
MVVPEEEAMIAGLLLELLADVVFGSAASLRRSFGTQMDRYFERRYFELRDFASPSKRATTSTR